MRHRVRSVAVVGAIFLGACQSPSEPSVLPELTTYTLPQALNPRLPSDIIGEMRGDTIRLVVPIVVPVDSLIPVFTTLDTSATVRIGSVTQRSGQSRVNFGSLVPLIVTDPSGAKRTYLVDLVIFTGLPIVTITTDGGAPILDRVTYVNGTVDVYGGKNRPDWSFRATTQIRGRGNSTWYAPKKPYRMRLTTSTSMVGFPANRDWALLANYWDRTFARNAVAFELSRQVGLAYTPRCAPIELVLNGSHQGSYQLCDHQEVSTNRIPAGPTGWYLELTSLSRVDPGDVFFGTPQVISHSKEWGTSVWVYKQPDPPTAAEQATIEAQLLRAETVLYGAGFAHPDTGYARHFDVESVIDWYLVMELTKNNDARFFNGVKIYRTATGKITFGPVWDFDLAYGQFAFDPGPTGWRIKDAAWIARFFDDRAFITKLKAQWQALYAKRAQVDTYLQTYTSQLLLSQRLSHAKWAPYDPIPSLRLGDLALTPPSVRYADRDALFTDADYAAEVTALRTWLNARWAWLNTAIMDL